jgi:glutamine---fructose-6-phosphate transaminase (isomerizing)
MDTGEYTYDEITHQAQAWNEALDVVEANVQTLKRLAGRSYRQVLFTGCGSTYYLSLAAAALFQETTGQIARGVPGGELLLNPGTVQTNGETLLVAISRSGSTTETVRAVEHFRQRQVGPVIAVTNYGNQPLAGLADVALVISSGQERSMAQTRSFASMYVATTAITVLLASRPELLDTMRALPSLGEGLLQTYEPLARENGENLALDRFYFLGSGARYGLACEANLKMKEMTLTHSEPFHFLEFRHGPKAMITPSAMVIGMLSESNRAHEQKVLEEMQALGGKTLGIGESEAQVNFNSGLVKSVRNVLYLPVLQLMAYYRARAKGLNPDEPANLTAVVKLEL